MGDDNWQIDVISDRLNVWNQAEFVNEDGSKTSFSDQMQYEEPYNLELNKVESLVTSDLDGNGLVDIVLSGGDKVHAYYNMGDDNWQMDVISDRLNVWSQAGFVNEDGSKTSFSDQTQLVEPEGFLLGIGGKSVDDNSYFGLQMSTDDLDGNGFEDIILSDGGRVHAYYNMGDDNWQIDVISDRLNVWNQAEFVNEDGSKTSFSDQMQYEEPYNLELNKVESLVTSDLDGNGLVDIVLSGGDKVHAYYNMGDDNWQMDVISDRLNVWSQAGFDPFSVWA